MARRMGASLVQPWLVVAWLVAVICSHASSQVPDFEDDITTVIYSEDFNTPNLLEQWTLFSETAPGTIQAPGKWEVLDTAVTTPPCCGATLGSNNKILRQFSNIYNSFLPPSNQERGTILSYDGGLGWTDYQVKLRWLSTDNDMMGITFRYTDSNNFYEFVWSSDDFFGVERKLRKRNDGVFTDIYVDNNVKYIGGTTSPAWYGIKIDCFVDRINIWLRNETAGEVDYQLWTTQEHRNHTMGTIGPSCVGNQDGYFDDIEVKVRVEAVSDLSTARRNVTGGVRLGREVRMTRKIDGIDTSVTVGNRKIYSLVVPAGFEDQSLVLNTRLNESSICCVKIYAQKDSLVTPSNFLKATTDSRTAYTTLTIPNVAAGTYYIMLEAENSTSPDAEFAITWDFGITGSQVVTQGLSGSVVQPLHTWRYFKYTVDVVYTGFKFYVTPNPTSTQADLRVVLRRTNLPTRTSGEYDVLTLTPNGNGVYIVDQRLPALSDVYYFGVFVTSDPDPNSYPGSTPPMSIEYSFQLLPDAPNVLSLTPFTGDTPGTYDVVIAGDNLGSELYPSLTSVAWGATGCLTTTIQPSGNILCKVPEGQGRDIAVNVTHLGQVSNNQNFNYNPPTIQGFSAVDRSTKGGGTLVITGLNFGLVQTASVNNVDCPVLPGATHTSLSCTLPPGQGTGNDVKVLVGGQLATSSTPFQYAAPIIENIEPNNGAGIAQGPTAGGILITVSGQNFGTSGDVRIGGNLCTPAGQHNHSQIICTLPAGQGTSQEVKVSISGQDATSNTFNYDGPEVFDLSPRTGNTAGGTVVSITGKNFGTTAPTVLVNNGLSCTVLFFNQTFTNCSMPPGQGRLLAITVTVGGQVSAGQSFDYLPPTLTSITPDSGPTLGGTTVVLQGTNFGNQGTVLIGTKSCSRQSHNHTHIVCTTPLGSGSGLEVVVSVADLGEAAPPQTTNSTVTFSYEAPSVTSVFPQNGPTAGGTTVTVTGKNFGTSGSILIGGTVCTAPAVTYTDGSIECTTSEGSGTDLPVSVSVDGQVNDTFRFSYDAPNISSITPHEIPTGGEVVGIVISGSNFGPSTLPIFVTVNVEGVETNCPVRAGHTHVTITCDAPVGRGLNRSLTVSVKGQNTTVASAVSYANPSITQVTPQNLDTQALDGGNPVYITITGSSFDTSGTVTVGGSTCVQAGTFEYGHTRIVCQLPPGQGKGQAVIVTTADGRVSQPGRYDYNAPVLSESSLASGSTSGDYPIVLTGSSFGTSGTVTIGGRFCVPVAGLWSHTSITCLVPYGQGSGKQIVVTVGGQTSDPLTFSYNNPQINTLTPPNGPTSGQFQVTIGGSSFGNESNIAIEIGESTCQLVSQTHDEVVCDVPEGVGDLAVSMTVSSLPSNTNVDFQYDAPSQISLTPTAGDTSGGTTLMVHGVSMGANGRIFLGGVECALVGAYNHTYANCSSPAGQGINKELKVEQLTPQGIARKSITIPNAFSYNKPLIERISPVLGPTAGQVDLLLYGFSFGDEPLGTAIVRVGNGVCTISERNHTHIICQLPAGQGTGLDVTVEVTGQVSDAQTFSYSAPTITAITGPEGANQNGNTNGLAAGGAPILITIDGLNFGQSGTITVNGQFCNVPSAASGGLYSDDQIKCTLPAGQGSSVPVLLDVAGQQTSHPYRYKAPSITSITPTSGPTEGGSILTIFGTNFGVSGTVLVDGNECTTSTAPAFYDHLRIECFIPEGQGAGVDVTVNVSGVDHQISPPEQYSYNKPTVTFVHPSVAPTSGGTILTVDGTSFGSASAVVSVSVGGVPCPINSTLASLRNHSRIFCSLPAGTGVEKDVVVEVNSQDSTTTSSVKFSYAAPVITSMAAEASSTCTIDGSNLKNCDKTGGKTITLFGTNFGARSVVPEVKIFNRTGTDFAVCTFLDHGLDPHSAINCTLPAGNGFDRPVTVTVDGQESNQLLLSYAGPFIYGNSLRLQNTSGPTLCTEGECNTNLQVSSINGVFQTVTFNGRFLRLPSGADPIIRYGPSSFAESGDFSQLPFECTHVSSTANEVNCTLASVAIGHNLSFAVNDGEQWSPLSVDTLSYPTPELVSNTTSTPTQSERTNLVGSSTEGELILFKVKYVGDSSMLPYLFVNYGPTSNPKEFPCSKETLTVVSYDAGTEVSQLQCRTAPGDGQGLRFTVTALNVDSAPGTDTYSYPRAPVIFRVTGCTDDVSTNSTRNCPTKGSVRITVEGTDFVDTASIRVGVFDCPGVQTVTQNQALSCDLPAGAGLDQAVLVVNGALFSRTRELLSYAVPTLTKIEGCTATGSDTSVTECSRTGTDSIMLTGTNFGASNALVLVGGSLCTPVSHDTSTPHEKVTCQLPSGTTRQVPVFLLQSGGEISNNTLTLDYEQCPPGTFQNGTSDLACTSCQAGRFSNAFGVDQCEACELGRFSGERATVCEGCPTGKFSVATGCTLCQTGRSNDKTAQSVCAECGVGEFQDQQGQTSCKKCARGSATDGLGSVTCPNCTAGLFASELGSVVCTGCESGRYAPLPAAESCLPCAAGNYSSGQAKTFCLPCDKGQANPVEAQTKCPECDAGRFTNVTGKLSCDACVPGRFSQKQSNGDGATACELCAEGSYVPTEGQPSCLACEIGKYQPSKGQVACLSCPPGFFRDIDVPATGCSPCGRGLYAPQAGAVKCDECPIGKFNDRLNSSLCFDCPEGKFQDNKVRSFCEDCRVGFATSSVGQFACTACSEGFFANVTGSLTCKGCPAGRIAGSSGSENCTACTPGSFTDVQSQSVCKPCPQGRFGDDFAMTVCDLCLEGTASSSPGSQECTNCTAGTFADAGGASVCALCGSGRISTPAASFCFQCSPGFVQPDAGKSFCSECDPGFFAGSSGQLVCPDCIAGRFSNETGASMCFECPKGQNQPAARRTFCADCDAGRASTALGEAECDLCPAGEFGDIPGLSACKPCPRGKISDTPTDLSLNLGCVNCTAGRFAATTRTLGSLCTACDAGRYNNQPGLSFCIQCSAGESQKDSGQTQCDPCSPGFAQSAAGQPTCNPCLVGTFAENPGQAVCDECQPGKAAGSGQAQTCNDCLAGFFAPTNGTVTCSECPAGRYQMVGGQSFCLDCPVGFFQANRGESFCSACENGTFAAVPGLAACAECEAGTQANATGLSRCFDCPAGTHAPSRKQSFCQLCQVGRSNSNSRQAECVPCDVGRFADGPGRLVCTACSPGQFAASTESDACSNCTQGDFSSGEGAQQCLKCDPGTFSLSGYSSCVSCDVGFEQPKSARSSCDPCLAGFFASTERTADCQSCPIGRFSNETQSSACISCVPGRFAPKQGATICDECPIGTAVDAFAQQSCVTCRDGTQAPAKGMSACTACDEGRFSRISQVQPVLDSCRPCRLGTFVNSKGQALCLECRVGFYAGSEGTVDCLECAPGTEASSPGQQECSECNEGFFASQNGTSSCEQCGTGRFSNTTGSTACSRCLPGLAQPAVAKTECNECIPGFFTSLLGSLACDPCPLGRFTDVNSTVQCTECPAGSIAPSVGASECTACAPGFFAATSGLSVCAPCPIGEFQNESSALSCIKCPRGSVQDATGQSLCTECTRGKFAVSEGLTLCEDCAAGFITTERSQSACVACDAGNFSQIDGATSCQRCDAGRFTGTPGLTECQECTAGFFSDQASASFCSACFVGQVTNKPTGAFDCSDCLPGTFAAAAATQCTDCAAGRFSNTSRAPNCHLCPAGSSTNGATRATECVPCTPGRFAGAASATCQTCGENSVCNRVGCDTCDACPTDAIQSVDFTECLCRAGFYARDFNGVQNCIECPTGADCTIPGRQWSTLPALSGFWRENNNSDTFYRCLIRTHCENAATTGPDSTCGGFRTGPICAVCKEGYHSPTTNGECVECPSERESLIRSIFISLVILILLIVMYYVVLRTDRGLVRDAKLRDEKIKSQEWTWFEDEDDYTTRMNKNLHELSENQRMLGLTPRAKPNFTYKMKIVLGFFQITTNLAFTLDIPWPTFYQEFIQSLGFVNFDFVQWSSVGCVVTADFYTKYLAVTITPILIFLCVAIFFLLPRYIHDHTTTSDFDLRRAARKRSRRRFWKLFLFTLFLIYPGVSSTVFRLYICRNIGGKDYLLADFSIECYTDKWRDYSLVNIIFILLYPIGIPLFFYALLRADRDRLGMPDVRVQLGFLYEAYTNDMWWFELADMGNKLFLTSLLGFWPDSAQLPVGIGFSLAFCSVLLLIRPYIRKGDDRLHLFAQVEIFNILLAAYVLDEVVEIDTTADVVLSIVLIFLILGFILFFLVQVAKIVRTIWRRRGEEEKLKKQKELELAAMDNPTQLQQLRLPKDALMVRNPLFQTSSNKDVTDPFEASDEGDFSETDSYTDTDDDDLDLEQKDNEKDNNQLLAPPPGAKADLAVSSDSVSHSDQDVSFDADTSATEDTFKAEFGGRAMSARKMTT